MEDFTSKLKDDLKSAVKSVKDAVNKEVHHYSLAEVQKDILKTAVVTSTALFTIILTCATGGE
jgi:hypothetical protein